MTDSFQSTHPQLPACPCTLASAHATRREAPDPGTTVIWLPEMADPIKFLCSEIHTKKKKKIASTTTEGSCSGGGHGGNWLGWRGCEQPTRKKPMGGTWPDLPRVEGQSEGPQIQAPGASSEVWPDYSCTWILKMKSV